MQKFYSYFNERGAKSSDLTPLVYSWPRFVKVKAKFGQVSD